MLGHRLLEAVFGDPAVRRLTSRAREDLNHRMMLLLDGEQRRYSALLDGLGISAEAEEVLRSGARTIENDGSTNRTRFARAKRSMNSCLRNRRSSQ